MLNLYLNEFPGFYINIYNLYSANYITILFAVAIIMQYSKLNIYFTLDIIFSLEIKQKISCKKLNLKRNNLHKIFFFIFKA